MRILIVRKVIDSVYSCIEVTTSTTVAWHLHKNAKGQIGPDFKEVQLVSTNLTAFNTIL